MSHNPQGVNIKMMHRPGWGSLWNQGESHTAGQTGGQITLMLSIKSRRRRARRGFNLGGTKKGRKVEVVQLVVESEEQRSMMGTLSGGKGLLVCKGSRQWSGGSCDSMRPIWTCACVEHTHAQLFQIKAVYWKKNLYFFHRLHSDIYTPSYLCYDSNLSTWKLAAPSECEEKQLKEGMAANHGGILGANHFSFRPELSTVLFYQGS